MDLVVYSQYYRTRTPDRQLEIDECLRRNLNHPGISRMVLFCESDAPPVPEGTVPVEVVSSDERITYAEWFRWVKRQGSGIGLLLNADIYLDEGLEHLTATCNGPDTFLALTRYNPGHAGFHLNDYPHWTQDVWGVRADAELPESLLYASSFPLGFPGCDNRIAYVMWSHGFRVRNPCYHVRSVHLQASTARAYDKTSDRLYGGVSYVHPSLAPDEDAELEFTLWTRSQQHPAGVLINQQAIEQGVHQLRHGEAEVAQRFLDLQQLTGLSWVHEAVGSAHLQGELHSFASEDTVFLPIPALLEQGVELLLQRPTKLEGLTLRLPRRAPSGYQLGLEAHGDRETQLQLQGEAGLALKAGGERRFWQPAELKGTPWQRLRLKLTGPSADPIWRNEEGAELVLFGEEGALDQAKSLAVIAEEPKAQAAPAAEPDPAAQSGERAYQWRRRKDCEAQLAAAEELHSYGRRFRVLRSGEEMLFDDRFWPSVGVSPVAALPCELEDAKGLLLWGFGQPALELRTGFIANTKRFSDDVNFWQYPCRTEGDAFAVHQSLMGPQLEDGVLQLYLGLPWATWIDRRAWPTSTLKAISERLRTLRDACGHQGVGLRVHSVCQHIFWRENLHLIKAAGVNCLWLSHKPMNEDHLEGVDLKAWHLYAVNAREPGQRASLKIRPPASRPWLATFVGAHMDHYITDVRPKLMQFRDLHRFYIQLKDEWHFASVVYGEQAEKVAYSSRNNEALTDDNVRYNRILSDSQFSLCPSGAGPNTLRLWEALSIGSVPVILSDQLVLPDIDKLSAGRWQNWNEIVIFHPEAELEYLPKRLEAISVRELERRSAAAIALMELVNKFTCIGCMADRTIDPISQYGDANPIKPMITIPVYGPTDRYYWRQKKHGFYDVVMEWYLRGRVEIGFGGKGYFWWGETGDILLMERDLVVDMHDRKVDPPRWEGNVPYSHAFFFNQHQLRSSRNHIATYFTYSPAELERFRARKGRNSWEQRKHKTIFAGSIENETQEHFRRMFAEWASSIDIFSCADRLNNSEPHEYTQEEYLSLVSKSRFGVCFRGNGPKCFRELEYLALGTPLIVTRGVCINYPEPLREGIHYFKAESPEDIDNITARTSQQDWDRMSQQCWDWFTRNGSIDNIFTHISNTVLQLDLEGRRHTTIRIMADYTAASQSVAVKSLEIFDPNASWIDQDDASDCFLTIGPNDLIVNELPFYGREEEYVWSVPEEEVASYLQEIYDSELETHKRLLICLGLKFQSIQLVLNNSTDIRPLLSRRTGNRAIALLEDDVLEVKPDYNWKRLLSTKYQHFSRHVHGPCVFSMPSIEAYLCYEKFGVEYQSNLSEHFAEYYAANEEVIPQNKVFRLCKLWEYEECSLIAVTCYIDNQLAATYKDPSY